jgi:hypothetical protein
MAFLHGVEVVELDGGARPISGVKSSVIGLVGTAPIGPVNEPVLISGSRKQAVEKFGVQGGGHSIPDALDAIFDQAGAMVVVINVLDPSTHKKSVAAKEYTLTGDSVKLDDVYVSNVAVQSQDTNTDYTVDTHYTVDTVTGVLSRVDNGGIAADAVLSIAYDIADPTQVTATEIKGGVDSSTNQYTGIQALLGAENSVYVTPRILIAPGYSGKLDGSDLHADDVNSDLISVADRLRAITILEGPNTSDADAITYRKLIDSARAYLVDPGVMVADADGNKADQSPVARVAGIIAKSDNERGFWWSPSNRPMLGILGTKRPIDFALGDSNARANQLNENDVATIIRQNGYRLWGNHSCSSDAKWQFISVRRTADLINDALLRAHLWAVDRNISKTYVEDVLEGVNNYLRHLKSIGAIINGRAWADPELNTPSQIQLGKVTFDFDFTPPYPAEHITFRSRLVDNYLEEIFA